MATIAAMPDDLAAPQGHPKGLYVLFGAEMWERFSYYGMRALLVLYLTKELKWNRPDALAMYAFYTGMVYFTPLFGGIFADRILGQRKAVLIGGIIFAFGHFAMAFRPLLDVALGLLIVGNGFFKPNISTMVGKLYDQTDRRKDAAYTIFYMGINIGGFISPLVCGYLGERIGWHYGFGAAGVGMVFGLMTFIAFQHLLGTRGLPPGREESGAGPSLTVRDWVEVIVWAAAWIALVYGVVTNWPQIKALWTPAQAAAMLMPGAPALSLLGYRVALGLGLSGLLYLGMAQAAGTAVREDPAGEEKEGPIEVQAQRVAVILTVGLFSVLFWMAFEQAGGTTNLFTDEKTDRHVGSFEVPTSWFQSINSLFIVLLAPVMSALWSAVDSTRFKIPSSAKQGLGLIGVGLGFVVMRQADVAAKAGLISIWWVTAYYLLATVGELCMSPIGLSLVNKLAPAKIASLMMASWFLCTAIANYAAGNLEAFLHKNAPNLDLFTFLIASSVIPGLLLLAITPLLKKMSHGRL